MHDDSQNTAPGSSFGKESEPIVASQEPIRPSEDEPVLSREEDEAGVTVIPKEHPIPEDAREAGLDFAKESAQPSFNPKLNVPMTKQQAQAKSKGSVYSSFTWLASLVNMLFKKQEERG